MGGVSTLRGILFKELYYHQESIYRGFMYLIYPLRYNSGE